MITKQEQDEMREFARWFVRTEREDLERMRQGDRPGGEEEQPPVSIPDELSADVPPPRRI